MATTVWPCVLSRSCSASICCVTKSTLTPMAVATISPMASRLSLVSKPARMTRRRAGASTAAARSSLVGAARPAIVLFHHPVERAPDRFVPAHAEQSRAALVDIDVQARRHRCRRACAGQFLQREPPAERAQLAVIPVECVERTGVHPGLRQSDQWQLVAEREQ